MPRDPKEATRIFPSVAGEPEAYVFVGCSPSCGTCSVAVFRQSVAANRQRALYVPLLSFLPLLAQGTVLLVGGRMVVHGGLPHAKLGSVLIVYGG